MRQNTIMVESGRSRAAHLMASRKPHPGMAPRKQRERRAGVPTSLSRAGPQWPPFLLPTSAGDPVVPSAGDQP